MSIAAPLKLTITAPRETSLVAVPELPAPGPDEVTGRTLATLVSPGTELASAFNPAEPDSVEYPKGIGYSAVFVVDDIGADVQGLAVGDVVFAAGPHQSHQRHKAAEVLLLPEGLEPSVAVFARMIAVPMAALVTTKARPGDRVGVSGLGLVGNLGAQAFRAAGYRVSAWDPVAERRAGLPRDIAVAETAIEVDGAGEFEIVVEASGHDGAAVAAAGVVAKNGELVLTGTPWARRTDASAHELLHLIFHRYLHVRSGWEWQLPTFPEAFRVGSVTGNFRQALSWLASGAIDASGLAKVVSPSDAQAAFESLADRELDELTVIFDWR